MERVPERSHAGATGFKAPPRRHDPPDPAGEEHRLDAGWPGELHATLMYFPGHGIIDRSTVDLSTNPEIAPLFPDPIAEGTRYYRKTGLYPINHGMIVRREHRREESVGRAEPLQGVRGRANEIADRQRVQHVEYHILSGQVPPEAKAALEKPVLRHGIKANRNILETAAQYSHEQGLTPRLMKLDEIFAPSVLDV